MLKKRSSWMNRRSHDKLLVLDGAFPGKAMVITGGRNISLSYYGLKADGSTDPDTFRDLKILVKSCESDMRGPNQGSFITMPARYSAPAGICSMSAMIPSML